MLSTASRVALRTTQRPLGPRVSPTSFLSPAALRRLASTLAILERTEGKLNTGSLSAITAAKKIGGPIHGFVAGSNIKSVAEEAAKADGVEKIIAVENGAYDKVGAIDLLKYLIKVTYTNITGPGRELRPAARREHQKGWLHTRRCWAYSFRQEPHAPGGRIIRYAAGLRCHLHRG